MNLWGHPDGLGKLAGQLPGGVEVEQIVVRELFAMELLGTDQRATASGMGDVVVERGELVRVFAVAKWELVRERERNEEAEIDDERAASAVRERGTA